MERETKELITPVGAHKVIVKLWLTGREKREIQRAMFGEVSIKQPENEGKDVKVSDYQFTAEQLFKSQDIALKNVIVSVDGKSEDVLGIVLDMHEKDSEFVINEINKITSGGSDESKK